MISIKEGFERLEDTLVKNIASHIYEFEFHATATEEELIAYYGGGYVNRNELLKDTLHRLESDQRKLSFLIERGNYLKETYGTEDPQSSISDTLQRATGISVEQESVSEDASEDGSEEDSTSEVQ